MPPSSSTSSIQHAIAIKHVEREQAITIKLVKQAVAVKPVEQAVTIEHVPVFSIIESESRLNRDCRANAIGFNREAPIQSRLAIANPRLPP